jgi:hypothetical protein
MGPELNGTPSLQKAQLLIRDGTLPGGFYRGGRK